MRRLFYLVVAFAVIYGGYWFVGARTVEGAANDAIADLAAQGWDVGGTTADVRGFPSRFDTTVSDVALVSPDGLIAYEAPFVQALALSYRPNRVIVAMPDTQVLRIGPVVLDILSEGLRASGAVQASTDLAFEALTAEAQSVVIESNFGIGGSGGPVLLAMRASGPAAHTYDLYASLKEVQLPALGEVPPVPVTAFGLDAEVALDAPLDRQLTAAPAVERLVIEALTLDWAGATLRGEGELVPDESGMAEGEITLTITDHAVLVEQLARAGAIEPGVAPTWVTLGDTLSDGQDELVLPIILSGGLMRLGPLPIGTSFPLR